MSGGALKDNFGTSTFIFMTGETEKAIGGRTAYQVWISINHCTEANYAEF